MSSRSANVIATADFLRSNADRFNGLNQSRASRLVFSEIGIRVSPGTIRDLAAKVGVTLTTYRISKPGTNRTGMAISTKVNCLARAVKELYQTFEIEPTDDLKKILREVSDAPATTA